LNPLNSIFFSFHPIFTSFLRRFQTYERDYASYKFVDAAQTQTCCMKD
jgi:hypothetical protein